MRPYALTPQRPLDPTASAVAWCLLEEVTRAVRYEQEGTKCLEQGASVSSMEMCNFDSRLCTVMNRRTLNRRRNGLKNPTE